MRSRHGPRRRPYRETPVGTVSRETLVRLGADLGLPERAPDQLGRLLTALAAEPDPHTTVSEPQRALDVHVRDSLAALDVPAGAGGASGGRHRLWSGVSRPPAWRWPFLTRGWTWSNPPCARCGSSSGSRLRPASTTRRPSTPGSRSGRPAMGRRRTTSPQSGPSLRCRSSSSTRRPSFALGGLLVAWKGAPDPAEVAAGSAAAAELGLEPLEPRPVAPYRSGAATHSLPLLEGAGNAAWIPAKARYRAKTSARCVETSRRTLDLTVRYANLARNTPMAGAKAGLSGPLSKARVKAAFRPLPRLLSRTTNGHDLRHRQPEGRGGQDHHRREPRRLHRGRGLRDPARRPRPAVQCDDGARPAQGLRAERLRLPGRRPDARRRGPADRRRAPLARGVDPGPGRRERRAAAAAGLRAAPQRGARAASGIATTSPSSTARRRSARSRSTRSSRPTG